MTDDAICAELFYALKAMLVGTDKTLPEAFPGHTEAYLQTVAIPRALKAIADVGQAIKESKECRHD